MTAEQLKTSILQLAMSGKLTKQTHDEIVPEVFPSITGDDPFEIPETWVWTSAQNCGEIVVGATPKTARSEYWTNGDIKWLASGCCQDCHVFDTDKNLKMITQAGYDSCSTKLMPINTVLIALTGATAGKVGLLKTVACANQSVVGITAVEGLLPEYLYYHLMSRRKEILDDCKGSAQLHISKKYITEMLFAIPPIEEQKRIVAKIEELMPLVYQYAEISTKLNTLNNSFPDIMKKSIIQEAVQGKLVTQDTNDEPIGDLLKKISEEKQRLVKEGKIKKLKALPEITEEEVPFEIPNSWRWVRLQDLALVIVDCPHSTPHYLDIETGYYALGTKGIGEEGKLRGFFNVDKDTYLKRIERLEPRGNDIVYSREGSIICRAAILPDNMNICLGQRVMLIRCPKLIMVEYIQQYLMADSTIALLTKNYKGVGVKHINVADVCKLVVPVPPLEEQKRIVTKLKEILPLCETMMA